MLELRKWYGDCVSGSGETAIRHWATLAWGPFRIRYAAVLRAAPDGLATERITWWRAPEPSFDGATLRWEADRTGTTATWVADAPAARVTLVDSAACTIHWTVPVPAGRALVSGADGLRLDGPGYAECLHVLLNAGRLPLDQLRWGRFVAPGASLAWIDWRGDRPSSWALFNGLPVAGLTVGDDAVVVGDRDIALAIHDPITIRRAPLASGALKGMPLPGRWALRRFRLATETRWRSRGTLRAGGASHHGWVIHELVHFPRR